MHPHPLLMQKTAIITHIARHITTPSAGQIHHKGVSHIGHHLLLVSAV